MKILRAVLAGILGALAMSAAMFLLRLAGIGVSLEGLLGSLVEPGDGQSAWLAGFAIHLCIGVVAAVGYAVLFELGVQQSGLVVGAGLGLCHGLLAGLMMSGIPAMNPLTPGASAPGPFLQNIAYGPVVFLLLHVLYGAVVGLAYGPTLQHTHTYTRRAV